MKKLDYMRIIKTAAGAGIAITLAEQMGLRYSSSAGIIALLSIQDTKRETIRVMIRRVSSFLLSILLSAACFWLFGYSPVAVAVFLIPFSALSILFRMQEGISVNTVLITHFLAERSMTAADMGNEALLLAVGAGIGVILNLYIPGKEKQIRENQLKIEDLMRTILKDMSENLTAGTQKHSTGNHLRKLEYELDQGEKSAYEDMENQLLSETKYYIRYMSMRKMQLLILERIHGDMERIKAALPQASQIAGLMGYISASFQEYNNALGLLAKLDQVKLDMRSQPLPADRAEFENRAVLFRILLELEQFLIVKREFVSELSREEVKRFWKSR